jgi:hypothetical protein
MLHNGYLVHPDIWMLWFSFVVSAFVFSCYVIRVALATYDLIKSLWRK